MDGEHQIHKLTTKQKGMTTMNTFIMTLISSHIFDSYVWRILTMSVSVFCLIVLNVQAAPIVVSNTNDSGTGSLREALATANDGDAISFGVTGTVTLTSGELLVNKSVTITGPASDNLTVDGNHASRIFHVAGGVTVALSNLTIVNGASNLGGGIFNDHAYLTLSNCTVSGNSSSNSGGGIDSHGGVRSATLTLNNCTISGNSAASFGGGIDNDLATLTANNTTISGNSAFFAGAIENDGSLGSATLTLNNCTISGNSATFDAGGIDGYLATLTVNSCTISGNSGPYVGGIYNTFSTLNITDTILKSGVSGQNIYNGSSTVTSHGYNLSNDDGGGDLTATGDQINTDPMLGPLQDNGGSTFTHELLAGSPAIDAGDPNVSLPSDYDQRGSGYVRVAHGRIDIGAFEVQPTPTPTYAAQVRPPINADGTSTFNVRRGVVPVKFTLAQAGVPTCTLPPATIAVTRTAGGVIGPINESVYSDSADLGSNFRIESCQYAYNLNSRAFGVGTYRVDILIAGQVVGNAVFTLN